MSFSCPLCHQPLSREKNSYICPQRHQFDMAKEGYVNLLPVQHKRSRDPGDSAEMMQARRAFLDAGHYQPLRDAIVAQLRHFYSSLQLLSWHSLIIIPAFFCKMWIWKIL